MSLLFGVLLVNGLLIEPKVFTHKDKVYPSSTHPDLTLYQVLKDRELCTFYIYRYMIQCLKHLINLVSRQVVNENIICDGMQYNFTSFFQSCTGPLHKIKSNSFSSSESESIKYIMFFSVFMIISWSSGQGVKKQLSQKTSSPFLRCIEPFEASSGRFFLFYSLLGWKFVFNWKNVGQVQMSLSVQPCHVAAQRDSRIQARRQNKT